VCGGWLPTLIPKYHSSLSKGPKWPLCLTPPVKRRCIAVGVCSDDACRPSGLHWLPESGTSTIDLLSFGPRIFWWNPHDGDITAGSRHNLLYKKLVWPLTGGMFHNFRNAKAVSSSYSREGDQSCRFTAPARRRHGTLFVGNSRVLGPVVKLEAPRLAANQLPQTQTEEPMEDDNDPDAMCGETRQNASWRIRASMPPVCVLHALSLHDVLRTNLYRVRRDGTQPRHDLQYCLPVLFLVPPVACSTLSCSIRVLASERLSSAYVM